MILILAGMLLRKASQKSLRRNSHATFPPLPASPPPPTRQIAPLPAHPSAPSAPDATAHPSPNSRRPSIPPPPPRRPPSAPPPSDSTPPPPPPSKCPPATATDWWCELFPIASLPPASCASRELGSICTL